MKILMVDDEASLLSITASSLEMLGHEVYMALTGVEAIRTSDKLELDLILCDYRLPDMDGLKVFQETRKDGGAQSPLFLLCSGFSELPITQPYPAGFRGVLNKPFTLVELKCAIEEATVLKRDKL